MIKVMRLIRMDTCFIINSKSMSIYDVQFKKIKIKIKEQGYAWIRNIGNFYSGTSAGNCGFTLNLEIINKKIN